MAIADDWAIDYTNKRVYHNTGTTVYSVNELYSWLMDTFDELAQMDDPVPMSAQTPTEYTFINGWFIDDESVKYLEGGAIKTSGYDGEIQVLKLDGITADPVASDIGKMVQDDGVDAGELLAYEIDPYGADTGKWWIRATGTIADNSAMTIPTGTGAGTANGDSVTGEDLYANIYTLGTITTDPSAQIYVFQAGAAISEWSNLTNWDRGHIDVLIKVKEAGTEIDGAAITVFARQYGDLFDNYEIDLTAGGRNAVPIATSTDIDNATAEKYLFFDAKTGDFTAKLIVTGGTSGATAEIKAVTDWTETANTGMLALKGIKGTFADNETITDTDTGSATVNGTVGDTYLAYDAMTVAFAVDYILTGGTSGAKREIKGIQADAGAVGKLCLNADVDYETNSNYYKAFDDNETITDDQVTPGSATADGVSTTIVSGYRDIGIWFMNGTLEVTSNTSFTVGLTLTGGTSTHKGIILEKSGSTTLKLANITGPFQDGETVTDTDVGSSTVTSTLVPTATLDLAMEGQSAYPYNIVVECRSRTVADVYEYFKYLCREDSIFSMYKLDSKSLEGAVADDGGTQTDETTEANNPTANDMTLLPAVPAVNDAYYFGGTDKFYKLELNIGTSGDGVWTIVWEYFNGIDWTTALPDISDGTDGFKAAAGKHDVKFSVPTDWATTAVAGITAYWIRARVTAYTSIVTQPLGTQAWLWNGPTVLDGEEYIIAFEGYAPKKASPLGTFAGGVLFAARGLWLQNMATADVQNYRLIDANGNAQTPPNKQPLTVTALKSGDRVTIFRTSAGAIDKAMYTMTAQAAGATSITIAETPATDTPADNPIRVVDVSANEEQRYRYASFSGSVFSLVTDAGEGTVTTAGSPPATQLIDSAADFGGVDTVMVGDLIRNTTDGSVAVVTAIVSTTELTTTPLTGGTDNSWELNDAYDINKTDRAYTTSDKVYIPFIDGEATTTSIEKVVIYTADRAILTRVRKKGIIPFEIAGDYVSTGYTVAAIRTTDAIVT